MKINRDRDYLRRLDNPNNIDQEMLKGFNYFDALLSFKSNDGKVQKNKKSGLKAKIKNLNTFNILYYVHSSLKIVDKNFIKKLDYIKDELNRRNDLFNSVVEYLEWCTSYEDDLYCWYPGLKTCDIFSFVLELLPNIVHQYKDYYTRALILGESPKTKILDFFKDRISRNLICFDIISQDFKYFSKTILEDHLDSIKNISYSKKDTIKFIDDDEEETAYKIITGSFWIDEDDPANFETCNEAFKLIGSVCKTCRYNQNIVLEIAPSLSFVDIEIGKKCFTVSLIVLNDLLTRNERSKKYWKEMEVIDNDWNYI